VENHETQLKTWNDVSFIIFPSLIHAYHETSNRKIHMVGMTKETKLTKEAKTFEQIYTIPITYKYINE
jgi:cytochrome c-type biogenesis protein CcmE